MRYILTEEARVMMLIELVQVLPNGIKVLDSSDGRMLAERYTKEEPKDKRKSERYSKLSLLEVLDVWADVELADVGFGNYARPILKCYVHCE